MAKASNEVYTQKKDRKGFDGYDYVKGVSTNDIAVFFNNTNNDYIISHRGTQLDDNEALEADLLIAAGKRGAGKLFTRRNKRTKGLVENIKEADPNANIHLTGHSLGGSSVINSMNDEFINNNVKSVHTFNTGVSPIHSEFKGSPGKITNHVVFNDPISTLGPHVGKVLVNKPKSNVVIKAAGDILENLSGSETLGDIVRGLEGHSIANFL